MRRTFSILLALLFAAALHAAEKPNVLFIMADDLRDYGGVFTRELVKTPNLDRLRARAVTFERAYVQYPICNPSRTSLFTGLRCEQTDVTGNKTMFREKLPDIVTLPQALRQQGWFAACYGKIFHLGGGRNRAAWMDEGKSWDEAKAFKSTAAGEIVEGRNVTGDALKWCHWGATAGTEDDQPDGQTAVAAIAAIEKQTAAGRPWFIGAGFHRPHDPFVAPKKYFDLYPIDALPLWRDPAGQTPAPPLAVGFGELGKAFAKFTDREWRELLRAYCAGTSFMDAQVGRLLDLLDHRKLWDKTLVVFVGDHGYHTGERGWWNKGTLFERSCRAPLIIAAPGVKGGQTSRSLVEFVDLYPTVADLCGVKAAHALAGASLRSVLADPRAAVKDAAFTLAMNGGKPSRSIRTERWRFTQWHDGQTELYDHHNDPEETHNVAAQPEHATLIQALRGRIAPIAALSPKTP
ncbi:MAG: sulfatase [Verrucomicrobiota bacterium]|nr:sulfatase [Verrucomicrobiota bacterium]